MDARCIWLTGLSAAGKSTIARQLAELWDGPCVVLDGDEIRQGLCSDLGFSPEDRDENIRRISEVARLFVNSGTTAICAFISPYSDARQRARARFSDGQFVLVHVDCPLDVCRERDPKGLYARAFAGELPGFTGVDAPYERPAADIVVQTHETTPEDCARLILSQL